jgi:Icc-related predicted phosphoesterase
MTKILAVGDFHGKLPTKLFNAIKKENPDFILTPGDFCGNERLGKLEFKHYGALEKEIPRKVRKEMSVLHKKSRVEGLRIIQKLKTLRIQTYGVLGNWDPKNYPQEVGSPRIKSEDKKYYKKLKYLLTRKFKLIDFKILELTDFILVGGACSTSPGKIDKKVNKQIIKASEKSKRKTNKFIKRRIKEYKRREKIYLKNFTKAREISRKIDKPIIFLTHNAPYGTKMSKIRAKSAPKEIRGKHMGSYLERKMINRFKPDIVICGHMHENFGKQKLGKTLVINSGTAMNGNYVKFEVGKK